MKKARENYNYNSVFPTRLRTLMDEKGETQQEIATLCSTQRQAVSGWMLGNTRPDILSLVKISKHFNVSTDFLLGLTEHRTTDKATLELCKRLNLSDETIDVLSGNVSSSAASAIFETFGFETITDCADLEEVKKTTVDVVSKEIADVFDRLVFDWIKIDKNNTSLLQHLITFFVSIDAENFSLLRKNKKSINLDGNLAIWAENVLGNCSATPFFAKDLLISTAITDIIESLNRIKKERAK